MSKLKNTKGFTLIELLVVIVIMGILATAALSFYSSSQKKARDAVRKSNAIQIMSAMVAARLDAGDYDMTVLTFTSGLTDNIGSIPKDSYNPAKYRYIFGGHKTQNDYFIATYLEGETTPLFKDGTGGGLSAAETGLIVADNVKDSVNGGVTHAEITNYCLFTMDSTGITVVPALCGT